ADDGAGGGGIACCRRPWPCIRCTGAERRLADPPARTGHVPMTARIPSSLRGRPVVAICGGVGGAKLALGLERTIGADLTIIVNTGDDFEHLGLHVSPDIDTVVYTLGGLSDIERGWGRAGETWNFMDAIGGLGGETWFRLGDRDLAMHVGRTRAHREGTSLTEFTTAMTRKLKIAARILPMSDQRVETLVVTEEGTL